MRVLLASFVLLAAPPAAKTFTNAGVVTFKASGALKEKKIGVKKTWGGTTPDGTISIFGFDMKGWLQTPKGTFPFAAAHVARTVWTSDNSRGALLQYLGPLVVLDTQTGKVIHERKGTLECDARFVGNDTLYVHEESKDPKARLYKIDLKTGTQTAISNPRRVDQCAASDDAQKWILYDEYAKDSKLMLLDVKTNKHEPLAHGAMDNVVLSGERACYVRNLSVICVRTDHTEEKIATDIEGVGLQMDPTGARMLIQAFYSVKGNSVPVTLLVDFAAGSVRELRGPTLKSGGSVQLMSGGKVIATGSSGGVEAYDVETGKSYSLKHKDMYSVHALPGAERKIIGEEDNQGDTFIIEVP
jgi:hypothetical protein